MNHQYPCGINDCDTQSDDYAALCHHIEVSHPGMQPPPPPEPLSALTDPIHDSTADLVAAEERLAAARGRHNRAIADQIKGANPSCFECGSMVDHEHTPDCSKRGPAFVGHGPVTDMNDPNDIETIHAEKTTQPDTFHDPTANPMVERLPAQQTRMTPAQFENWMNADGDIFVVYLPGRKSFVMKVPDDQHAFFVAMMQQIRFALGNEVQAIRMHLVTAPPADIQDTSGFAPANDADAYAAFTANPPTVDIRPPERFDNVDALPVDTTDGRARCPGSGQPCPHPRNRDVDQYGNIRNAGRGPCPVCSGDYKLTNNGNIRAHRKA